MPLSRCQRSPTGQVTWRRPHLLTLRTVVIDVQHVDVHADRGLELPVGGHDSEGVTVPDLPVQRLLQDQAPPPLALLDDGELAQRISLCGGEEDGSKLTPWASTISKTTSWLNECRLFMSLRWSEASKPVTQHDRHQNAVGSKGVNVSNVLRFDGRTLARCLVGC